MEERDDCAFCIRGLLCETKDGSILPLGSAHPCGHCFHTECFGAWQQQRPQPQVCPICRTRITSFERIFLNSQETDQDLTAVSVEQPQPQQSLFSSLGNAAALFVGGAVLFVAGVFAGRAMSESDEEKKKKQRQQNGRASRSRS
jgi:hypothetical protein